MPNPIDTYLTRTRRYIGDRSVQNWSDAELVDCINEARNTVVELTGCIRSIRTYNCVAQQEYIDPDADVMSVVSASVLWTPTYRIPLMIETWMRFDAAYRSVTKTYDVPTVGAWYQEMNRFWLYPIPNSADYVVELNCIIAPEDIAIGTTTDSVPALWRSIVPYYAAALALRGDQQDQRAAALEARGVQEAQRKRASIRPVFIPRTV